MSCTLEMKQIQSLIGGIEVSSEKKEINLSLIKEAIIKNNVDAILTEINNDVFARSYPDSLQLVKSYYDSLYNARVANIKPWDGDKYINKTKKMIVYKSKTISQMLETLIIFMPILMEKDLIEIKNMFGISHSQVSTLLNNYKKIINHEKKLADLGEEQEKYKIAKTIYEEIVINGLSKQEFCKKYDINSVCVDTHIEILKEINEDFYQELKFTLAKNINRRHNSLRELTFKVGTYCKEKIKVEISDTVIEMPFTMLDYYCLTNYPPKTVVEFINNSKNFSSNSKEEIIKRNYARQMLNLHHSDGQFIPKEIILKNGMSAGKNGNIVQLNEEICDEIFNLFEKEEIPKYKSLIEKAFHRYAFGLPILPLKLIEKSKLLEEKEEYGSKQINGPKKVKNNLK